MSSSEDGNNSQNDPPHFRECRHTETGERNYPSKVIEQYTSSSSTHEDNNPNEAEIEEVEFLTCEIENDIGHGVDFKLSERKGTYNSKLEEDFLPKSGPFPNLMQTMEDQEGPSGYNHHLEFDACKSTVKDSDDEGSKTLKIGMDFNLCVDTKVGELGREWENNAMKVDTYGFDAANDSLAELNEEKQRDEDERLEKGILNSIVGPEKRHASEEIDEYPVSRADHQNQNSTSGGEFIIRNDTRELNEISAERNSQDSAHSMQDDSTKWTTLVIICALLLLVGVIIGIIVFSQRERQSLTSSTVPSNESSNHPSITPSFIQFEAIDFSNIPSSYSSRALNIPTTYLLVSPTVSPSKQSTPYPIKSSPSTRNPTSSPLTQPSLFVTTPPSTSPTQPPTSSPSTQPSLLVTTSPSTSPTQRPTSSISTQPSLPVTTAPSTSPTQPPTSSPSTQPNLSVTTAPSISPTHPKVSIELPINAVCTSAIGPLQSDLSSNFGTIANAGVDDVDRCGDIFDSGPGVWYYTIGTGGEMMAHTCLDTKFNSKITIFGGICDKPLCIEANDNFCGSGSSQSAVSWISVYGELYYILVTGNPDFKNGSFNLVIGARSNDECSTAIGPLAVEDPMPVSGSTIGATANDFSCDDFLNESNSVWYLVRGTGGEMTVDLCNETDFSVRITILTGSCTEFECITVSSIDNCIVTWKSELSQNYYILIGGQTSDGVGDFSLRLSTTNLPNNNECKDAIGPLSLDGRLIKGSTASASPDIQVPFCISAITANGLWYYVEGNDSIIQASLCDTQSYDTRVSIYRGSCIDGDGLSDLVCIDGSDDFCGKQGLVTWDSEFGVTYYILVHGYLEEYGEFSLIVTEL